MKKIITTLLIMTLSLFVIAGCSSPSKEEIASANFGTLAPDYENKIKEYIADKLDIRNPNIIPYAFEEPYKAYSHAPSNWFGLAKPNFDYGYIVRTQATAENDLGIDEVEYFRFYFKEGTFMREITSDNNDRVYRRAN